jgi:hypothetical protein
MAYTLEEEEEGGGLEVYLHAFLGGEWSASGPASFPTGKEPPVSIV